MVSSVSTDRTSASVLRMVARAGSRWCGHRSNDRCLPRQPPYTRPMSRVGPLLCPILVGRDDLLELADRRIGEAAAGRGQLLLLAGEAGIGKTRLLDAVRRKSRATGFIDANGSPAPPDPDVPSAPILH